MSGLFVIISSPSGGGKDTVIRALLQKIPNSAKLVTTTTRAPRQEDQEGVTYYFTDKPTFEKNIREDALIEHAVYADNYYGVEKKELENKLENFAVVFSNIDVQGRKNFSAKGIDHISIFLLPDNLDDLKARILGRGKIDPEDLEKRLLAAKAEIAHASEYDFQVINKNGHLDETIDNVAKIITSYTEKNG